MPNDEYILRRDAVFALCGDCLGTEACGMIGTPCDEVENIKAIPAADVEPKRKTGHWIKEGDDAMCSVCDEILCGEAWEDLDPIDDIGLHYCPNCGSRMLHEPPKEEDPV